MKPVDLRFNEFHNLRKGGGIIAPSSPNHILSFRKKAVALNEFTNIDNHTTIIILNECT
jgi:hypothetical protein